MKLIDVLYSECIHPCAAVQNKQEALREVARIACSSPPLAQADEATVLRGLEQREALGSTGFGKGIAIPHCRLKEATKFVVGVVTVPSGIDFQALDGAPVRLIVFIVAPERDTNEHIRLLSSISQALMTPGATDELLAEKTPEAIRESFLRYTRSDIDTTGTGKRTLFHVFVQDEAVFRDLLSTLAGIESSSVVVVDTENTGLYLAKMPLFAGFWRDEPSKFCRTLIAVVDRELTNETLRRVEQVTGPLDERDDVLVTAQDLYYSAGSLGTQP